MRPSDPPDEKLLELMHEISEGEFAAGWREDLEFDLWATVRNEWGSLNLPQVDVDELARLADACGGWWVHVSTVGRTWGDGTVPGRMFLPIAEWCKLYDEHKAKTKVAV
mgnify:CR=1 FL=1